MRPQRFLLNSKLLGAVVSLFLLGACAQAQEINLLDAIRLAERSRPSVQAAELRLRQAELTRSALGTVPPLRLEAGNGTRPSFGAGEDFLVALPIDFFGKTAANRASGNAGVDLAFANYRQVKLDLQTAVINAYADLVVAQIQIRTGQQLLDIQQRVYDATKKRAADGDLPPIQVQRADLDLERARQTLEVRRNALVAARQRLAAALGVPVEQVQNVDDHAIVYPSSMTTQRPDLQQLRASANTASAEVRIANMARLPDIELQFRRQPWDLPEKYNGRVQLIWNVLDWGAGAKRADAARSAREAANRDLTDRIAFSNRERIAAEADVTAALATIQSFAKLQSDAASLFEKQQRGFELGGNTLLDVLDASRILREIQDTAADAQLRLLQAQARYLAALGVILTESK